MYLNRRSFLKRASQLAVAARAISPALATSAEPNEDAGAASIPIVDTHQHLWDLSRLKLTWVAVGCMALIDLQGILWPVLLKQPLLLSLSVYAMLVLWGTLGWILVVRRAPTVSG